MILKGSRKHLPAVTRYARHHVKQRRSWSDEDSTMPAQAWLPESVAQVMSCLLIIFPTTVDIFRETRAWWENGIRLTAKVTNMLLLHFTKVKWRELDLLLGSESRFNLCLGTWCWWTRLEHLLNCSSWGSMCMIGTREVPLSIHDNHQLHLSFLMLRCNLQIYLLNNKFLIQSVEEESYCKRPTSCSFIKPRNKKDQPTTNSPMWLQQKSCRV